MNCNCDSCDSPSNGNAPGCSQGAKCNHCDHVRLECGPCADINQSDIPYLWFPSTQSVRQLDYVRKLECEFDTLQKAFLSLTTQYARMQFRLRQVIQATPDERENLLCEMEKIAFSGDCPNNDEIPHMQRDLRSMGDVRRKQSKVIEKLRNQLTALAEASNVPETLEGGGMSPSGAFPVPTPEELRDRYAIYLTNDDPNCRSHISDAAIDDGKATVQNLQRKNSSVMSSSVSRTSKGSKGSKTTNQSNGSSKDRMVAISTDRVGRSQEQGLNRDSKTSRPPSRQGSMKSIR